VLVEAEVLDQVEQHPQVLLVVQEVVVVEVPQLPVVREILPQQPLLKEIQEEQVVVVVVQVLQVVVVELLQLVRVGHPMLVVELVQELKLIQIQIWAVMVLVHL